MALLYDVSEQIATVTLNRPEAMNSLDPRNSDGIEQARFIRANADDAVRVVVLTGAGDRAFCTGSDLKKTMPSKGELCRIGRSGSRSGSILSRGWRSTSPMICAVNGLRTFAGGMELALALRHTNRIHKRAVRAIGGLRGQHTSRRRHPTSPPDGGPFGRDAHDADGRSHRCGGRAANRPCEPCRPARSSRARTARNIALRIAANAPLAVRAVKRLVRDGA